MISAQSKLAYLDEVSPAVWVDDSVLVSNPSYLDALAGCLNKVDVHNRNDFEQDIKCVYAQTLTKILEERKLRGPIKGRDSAYKKLIKKIENIIKFVDDAILYLRDNEFHPHEFLELFYEFPDDSLVTYQKFEEAARTGSLMDLKEKLLQKIVSLKQIKGQYKVLMHEMIYALIVIYNQYNTTPAKRAYSGYEPTRAPYYELKVKRETGPFHRFVSIFMQILCDEVCSKLGKQGFLQKGSAQEALLRQEFHIPTKIIRASLETYYSDADKPA